MPEPSTGDSSQIWAAFDDAIDPDGFRVEGYEILGELDRGGMGVVYHARQLQPEREVAVKVMLPKLATETVMRDRFQIEARAMAALENPGILPIYEVGESSQLPFFSMKLADGGSLAERLQDGAMPVVDAVDLMIEIAGAVDYAHRRGVLHRDLKPANLLFDDAGRPFVTDFGVAKLLASEDLGLTQTQTIVGTPYYMPPEVASGSASEATVSGDLYSLGAVFYECLTGERAHPDQENVALLMRAIAETPVPAPATNRKGLPPDVSIICRKAMELEPGDRYATVAEFRADLVRWREGKPIAARPISLTGRAVRLARRHPISAAFLALFLVTALAGGILLTLSYDRAQTRLHESLIAQAHAVRLQAAPGFRSRALDLLDEAWDLKHSPRIRNEAIAALAKFDLSRGEAPFGEKVETWHPVLTVDDPIEQSIADVSGERLFTVHQTGRGALWARGDATPKKVWNPAPGMVLFADFVKGKNSIIVIGSDEGNCLYDPDRPDDGRALPVEFSRSTFLKVSPTGDLVAYGGVGGLQVLKLSTMEIVWSSNGSSLLCQPSWSADGRHLAAATSDTKTVTVFDGKTGRQELVHSMTGWPEFLAFHPDGRLLSIIGGDGSLTLVDLNGVVLTKLEVSVSPVEFSDDGTAMGVIGPAGDRQWWQFHEPLGYYEWSGETVTSASTVVFGAKLSPDERHLLTITTAGIEIWNTAERRATGFHEVGNQRIDARTDAWWLPGGNDEILVQVPGAWEKLLVGADDQLVPSAERVNKVPGVTILDIREDGTWLVEALDEDGETALEKWPNGDPERFESLADKATNETSQLIASTSGGESIAAVLNSNAIRLSGHRSLDLTLPWSAKVRQILYTKDGQRLFGLSQNYRVFEWDLERMDKTLEALGFTGR